MWRRAKKNGSSLFSLLTSLISRTTNNLFYAFPWSAQSIKQLINWQNNLIIHSKPSWLPFRGQFTTAKLLCWWLINHKCNMLKSFTHNHFGASIFQSSKSLSMHTFFQKERLNTVLIKVGCSSICNSLKQTYPSKSNKYSCGPWHIF